MYNFSNMFAALFANYLLPHEKNNHKAKLLHPKFIFSFKVLFISVQLLLYFLPSYSPGVLGYSSSIAPDEIVELTNMAREESGAGKLKIDSVLTKAALAKASDMFARNYWAHTAPDGTEPWHFFIQTGYQYKYAGENLARDFSNSEDVVKAWMASPTHRENLISPRYQDIGVAVVEGELDNVKTTLVVQFFGTTLTNTPSVGSKSTTTESLPQLTAVSPVQNIGLKLPFGKISPLDITKNIAFFIVALLVVLFTIDLIVIRSKNIPRVSSRGFAHLLFLIMVLAAIIVVKGGVIL